MFNQKSDHNNEEIIDIQELPQIENNTLSNKNDEIQKEKDEFDVTINIYKKFKVQIYKPLITLKLMFFIWHGAGSFIVPFLSVYFKQRGITLSELSTSLSLSPFIQTMGTLTFGVLADKLGRSKPILIINIVLNILILSSILLIPRLNSPTCDSEPINLKCHPRQFDRLITKTTCDVVEDTIEVRSCNVQCPENVTDHCDGKNLICEILAGNEEMRNFSLSIHVAGLTSTTNDRCFYNVSSMSHKNSTFSWCNVPHKMYCRVSCIVESGVNCTSEENRTLFLVTSMVLYILFVTVYSNCYRFLDSLSMSMITEHNADYGQQRLFAILGTIVVSPIAGLIVESTTTSSTEKYYQSAFYFYIALLVILLAITSKAEVQLYQPGQRMGVKTLRLLKNPDVISFAVIILVLGTSFSFLKNFVYWYLEEMKSPSLLIGLMPAVGALYGLPFLATSSWWLNKLGAHNIFIIALLAYVINSTGYSFLKDPWFALILESTAIFTYYLLWVVVVVHSHSLAPDGLKASVVVAAGSIHYHIGKFSGSAIGGIIMNTFGGRIAFRVLAVICMVSAVLYAVYLYIRRTCFTIKLNLDKTQSAAPSTK